MFAYSYFPTTSQYIIYDLIMKDNSQVHQSKVFQEKEYCRIEQFSFRNLTQKHQAKALQILTHQFHRQEPLTTAYSKKYPNGLSPLQLWNQFFSSFIDDAATNNLSVVVLDVEANNTVIAVFICRDICFVPEAFTDSFQKKAENLHTFIFELENEMRKQLSIELEKILSEKGRTVDFMSVAINHDYLGRKVIFKNMLSLVEKLAKEAGYTHGHVFAGNGKTNIVAENANYQLIARVDASKIVLSNQQPFSQIEQFHRYPSLWLKEL